MNDPAFKTAAYKMAENTPKHLDQPTVPPQHWYLEGSNLVVLLADGRKVRGPMIDQNRENITPAKTVKPLPSPKPSSSPKKKK